MAEPIQLVANGSGIVPLMSMIRARLATQSAAPFRLLFSVRSPDRVWCQDELQSLVDDGIGVTLAYTPRESAASPPGSGSPGEDAKPALVVARVGKPEC